MFNRRYFSGLNLFFLLAITAAVGAAVLSAGSAQAGEIMSNDPFIPILPARVCMINNTVNSRPQIPVDVDGKTYYGCCGGCVQQLKQNPSARFAVDPLTGNKVDKALAFIVLDPANPDHALYFENKENVKTYFEGKR